RRLSWMLGRFDAESLGFSGWEPDAGFSPFVDSAADFSAVFATPDGLGSSARLVPWAENPRPIRIEEAPIKARAAIHDLTRMAVRLLPEYVGHPSWARLEPLGQSRDPRSRDQCEGARLAPRALSLPHDGPWLIAYNPLGRRRDATFPPPASDVARKVHPFPDRR